MRLTERKIAATLRQHSYKLTPQRRVVIRTIGLLLLMSAVSQILWALVNLIGGGPGSVAVMLMIGIPCLFVGLWFLCGAPILVSYAYKTDRSEHVQQTPLERDTLKAMTLLQAGKTEEAKAIVDKILNS